MLEVVALIIYVLQIGCFHIFCVTQRRRNSNYYLVLVFLTFQSVYVITPAIDDIFNLINYDYVAEYIVFTIYCNTLLISGAMFAGFWVKIPNAANADFLLSSKIKYFLYLMSILGFIMINYSMYMQLTDLSALLGGYLDEHSSPKKWEKLRLYGVAIFSTAIYLSWMSSKSAFIRMILLIFIVEVALLLLVRGYRTPLLLTVLPFLLNSKDLYRSYCIRLPIIAVLTVLLGQAIDIIRAAGLGKWQTVNFIQPASAGEFGQAFRSFQIFWDVKTDLLLGETIFIGPVRNIISTFGFQYEPISTTFAKIASANGPLFGFGFTPQLEAIWNFGLFGVLYFFCIGCALKIIETILITRGNYSVILIAMTPMFMIFQRIDLSVFIKMNAVGIILMIAFILGVNKKMKREHK